MWLKLEPFGSAAMRKSRTECDDRHDVHVSMKYKLSICVIQFSSMWSWQKLEFCFWLARLTPCVFLLGIGWHAFSLRRRTCSMIFVVTLGSCPYTVRLVFAFARRRNHKWMMPHVYELWSCTPKPRLNAARTKSDASNPAKVSYALHPTQPLLPQSYTQNYPISFLNCKSYTSVEDELRKLHPKLSGSARFAQRRDRTYCRHAPRNASPGRFVKFSWGLRGKIRVHTWDRNTSFCRYCCCCRFDGSFWGDGTTAAL